MEVFEITNRDFDVDETTKHLSDLFRNKATVDVERIHKMISLFESSGCLAMKLSKHFGETIAKPCGNCSFCLTGNPSTFQVEPLPAISKTEIREMLRELRDISETPVSDDLAARFLCGIVSPKLFQLKAKQLSGFGFLEKHPFKEVKSRISE